MIRSRCYPADTNPNASVAPSEVIGFLEHRLNRPISGKPLDTGDAV